MIAVNGYFDGNMIQTLEKLNARKNQRVIITLLDEDIQTNHNEKKMKAAGSLAKYANPNLIPMEEGAWERAVSDVKETS
ncbi:hypothetical protein [Enterocloster asparagiformis]|uniref:Uncharacterized protein n=1 Tax=Enterocloster asparagiformis TaxID=333367 RepID=A0A413FIS5_9FIRM|nr:hypothetical protein [Enterocloster asparagiformis]RGX31324.1 hypothetical protein DWV29_05405 [Enterocloster asparagiformis]UWO74652.1 hypothetical protein NQ535_17570 [[Clostridium] asparagiforme DSM 15981]